MDKRIGAFTRGRSSAIMGTMAWTTKSTTLLTSANIVSFLNDGPSGHGEEVTWLDLGRDALYIRNP
jgi:hypothetical protein